MGSLVSKSLHGFYNGISQQSVTMRLDSQGETQENALGTLVDGLYRRPPTEHITAFNDIDVDDAFIHTINRDTSERYIVFITGDADEPIGVYTIGGTKCTVRYGTLAADLTFTADDSAKDYLLSTEANSVAYKAKSIADYTVITNRSKVTAMEADLFDEGEPIVAQVQTFLDLPLPNNDLQMYSSSISYEKNERVKSTDGFVYKYIMESYFLKWSASALFNYNDYCVHSGVVWKSILNGINENITPVEGANWTSMGSYPFVNKALNNTTFWSQIERYCTDGEIYEISGDVTNSFASYYVKRNGEVWKETLKPGQKYIIDPTTMPHRLVRTGTNQFTFAPCLWEDRVVGDDNTAPLPSFIGKPITNLIFFKNRLGFISKETLFFSKVGKYFELFHETATDQMDDDPIDVKATSAVVVELTSSIAFDKALMVNSVQGQFTFGSGTMPLTPKTLQFLPTTAYETDRDSDPVGAGANIYFASPRTRYISLMEYLVQPDKLVEEAYDVTAHCPHYIPNGCVTMLSCVPMEMLMVFSTGDRNSVYINKYYWVGNEKRQNAWSKWTFNGSILDISIIDTSLYLMIKRGDETSLEKINLENVTTNQLLDFRVHLDRQVQLTGTYSSATHKTTWVLPYVISDFSKVVGVRTDSGFPLANITQVDDTTITADGDHSGHPVIFGLTYKYRYQLSEWFFKNQNGISDISGKLQIRTLTLAFNQTGPFEVVIEAEGRDTVRKSYSGVRVGKSLIGKPSLLDGEETFLIMAKSKYTKISIESESYMPCQIVSGTLEGMYVQRARII